MDDPRRLRPAVHVQQHTSGPISQSLSPGSHVFSPSCLLQPGASQSRWSPLQSREDITLGEATLLTPRQQLQPAVSLLGSLGPTPKRQVQQVHEKVQSRPLPSQASSQPGSTRMTSREALSRTPQPLGKDLPDGIGLDETVSFPPSARVLVDCNGLSLEAIVLDLQKSVELLLTRADEAKPECDPSWSRGVEGQLDRYDQLLAQVGADQAIQQEEFVSQINSWRGSVEDQLTQQAQLFTIMQSTCTQHEEALANITSWQNSSASLQDPTEFQTRLDRLDKLEERLPIVMVEQDMNARLTSLESYYEAMKTIYDSDGARLETIMQHNESIVEKLQADVAKLQQIPMQVPVDALLRRQASGEETVNQLQGELARWSQLHQEFIVSIDTRVQKLEDAADSSMNVMHWETIHTLCDNLQVQQNQQMEWISGLQAERLSTDAMLKQQMDVMRSFQMDKASAEASLRSAEARLSNLEELSTDGNMHSSQWESVQELCGNVQQQQEQQANLIHSLQSEIQSLLREYLIGTPGQGESPQSDRGGSASSPTREAFPSNSEHLQRPASLIPSPDDVQCTDLENTACMERPSSSVSVSDLHPSLTRGPSSELEDRERPPSSFRDTDPSHVEEWENAQCKVLETRETFVSPRNTPECIPRATANPSATVSLQATAPAAEAVPPAPIVPDWDWGEVPRDTDPALQVELSKFKQFSLVAAVQKDLVRLPQLR